MASCDLFNDDIRTATNDVDLTQELRTRIGLATTVLRLHLTYLWRHGRPLSLRRPTRFTEMVQHRKLFDRDARMRAMIDKLAVKDFVADVLGPEWVTPTLWSGTQLPPRCDWLHPFVVKSRHGCNQRIFVRDRGRDWHDIRRSTEAWMRRGYGNWLDEWGYREVPRGLLVEPWVGEPPHLPIDYKFYVFHGRVEAIQVHLDRERDHHWLLFDRGWTPLSPIARGADASCPAGLDRMIAASERLGSGFDFVRIDLYDTRPDPRFGEMTFYPGSGLDRFEPTGLDVLLGDYWRPRSVAETGTIATGASRL